MTTRREFLGAAGAAGAAATFGLLPRAALAVVSRAERLERIGLQLYTVRTEMQKNVETTLAAVAKVGYQEVEFAGYFQREPAALRALLDANGLTAPSAHVDMTLLERDWAGQAKAAKVVGHGTLIVAWVDRNKLPALDDWKVLARRFNEIGRHAEGDGMRFAYHNHEFEFPTIGGTRPYDVLLEETDPALVDFEMDLYWLSKAGADPLEYFQKHPRRFRSVHVKDGGPRPAFGMRDVGAGTIDWKRVFARRKQAGIEHYFVEHDNPAHPMASIAASCRYLRELSF